MTDLYRVGVPSIGEAYQSRWDWQRGSGGLGTGVYAFRTRTAAKQNIARASHTKQLYVLEDALSNPIQPTSRDATESLVRLSRKADLMAGLIAQDCVTLRRVKETPRSFPLSLSRRHTGCDRIGSGSPMTSEALDVLLHTPGLKARYSVDEAEMVRDLLDAAVEARRRCDGRMDKTCVQPVNLWLADEFDGIAPHSGAGGDEGRHGCVIFKEKIDRCVGQATEGFGEISAEVLNRCFAKGDTGYAVVR